MDTDSLRLLWQAVSSLSPDIVESMPYEELISNLLEQLSQQRSLSADDWSSLQAYLAHKEPLIRDLFFG